MNYHWNGLNHLPYVKDLDGFDKLRLFMHILIEAKIMLKHTSIYWKDLKLPNFNEVSDEWLCHYGSNLGILIWKDWERTELVFDA